MDLTSNQQDIGRGEMAKYILANSENHTRRGSRIMPGSSSFSSQASSNIVARNASEMAPSPLAAIMLNPWHAQLDEAKMLELQFSTGKFEVSDPVINMRVREVDLPEATTDQKIIFALMVIKKVYNNERFNLWADSWISGTDRSAESSGKFIAYLGRFATETRGMNDSLRSMGLRNSDLETIGAHDSGFCARASEAVFAAQMYVDRPDSWPLLASRSVSSAVAGLAGIVDFAAIAERAIGASSKTVMRTHTVTRLSAVAS